MKRGFSDLLSLKLFDESRDAKSDDGMYAKSGLLGVLVLVTVLLAASSAVLALMRHGLALPALVCALLCSTYVSVAEWRTGRKGRAMNQSFVIALVATFVVLSSFV